MNFDIRLSTGFWQHPKTHRLEKAIGLKGIRSLQILWCWCAQNRPDGNLEGFDVSDIEFVADWRGKKGAFVKACVGSWLDETESGFSLHEWADYNPYQAQADSREKARKEKARKAAQARWQKTAKTNEDECSSIATSIATTNASSNATTDAQSCSSNAQAYAQAMPPLPLPVPEELKESSLRSDSFCAELSGDSFAQQEPEQISGSNSWNSRKQEKPPSPPVITLPLNTGQEHPVMPGEVAEYQALYPAVDVEQELRNMRGWLLANPQKRKTKSGIKRFVANWLAGKQDKGGSLAVRASPRPGCAVQQRFSPPCGMQLAQKNMFTAQKVLAEIENEKMERGNAG